MRTHKLNADVFDATKCEPTNVEILRYKKHIPIRVQVSACGKDEIFDRRLRTTFMFFRTARNTRWVLKNAPVQRKQPLRQLQPPTQQIIINNHIHNVIQQEQMTMLFTSYVCDTCNPPGSVITKSLQQTSTSKYEKMWIYHDEDPMITLKKNKLFYVFPRKFKYDAVDVMYTFNKSIYENPNSRLYRVYYLGEEEFMNKLVYFVESEQDALNTKLNVVWLCEE